MAHEQSGRSGSGRGGLRRATVVLGLPLTVAVALAALLALGWKGKARRDALALLNELDGVRIGWREEEKSSWLPAPTAKARRVGSIFVSRTSGMDDILPSLSAITELSVLSLSETDVTSHGIDCLRKLKHLEILHVEGSPIGGTGLPWLEDLDLSILHLVDANVEDSDLVAVGELERLTSLSLSANPISSAGIPKTTGLTKLVSLELARTRVCDVALRHLRKLPSLESLSLAKTQVTDAGVADLARLPKLRVLNLEGTNVTGSGFGDVRGFQQLADLDCKGSKLTDAGLVHLRDMRNLWSLSLANTSVGDDGMRFLATLTGLRNLDLSGTQVSDVGLARLTSLPNLRWLRVVDTKVTPSGAVAFNTKMQRPVVVSDLTPRRGSKDPAARAGRSGTGACVREKGRANGSNGD